jgi:hypothetical protein
MLSFSRITITNALKNGIGRAAPISYKNWYTYSEQIQEIIKLDHWSQWEKELLDTNQQFPHYNLQNEVGLLLTTKKQQIIMLNRSSPENYMNVEIPWLPLKEKPFIAYQK